MRSCLAISMTLLSCLAAGCGRSSTPQSDSPTPSNKVSSKDAKAAKPRDKEQNASEKQPPDRVEGKPKTAAEQYKDLRNESGQALGELSFALEQAKTEEEKKGLTEKRQELQSIYANRFLELAAKSRKDPSTVAASFSDGKERPVSANWLALVWFIINADPEKDQAGFDKAVKIIFEDYGQEKITMVFTNANLRSAAERLPDCENRLRSIAEKHSSPEARGAACLFLAQHLIRQVKDRVEGKDTVKLTKEATELLERVIKRYGDFKYVNRDGVGWVTLVLGAKEELAALRKSVELIGTAAPEIDGEDIDGKPMKLSAYRGKVVVLSFWYSGCVPCRKMIPDEKALVKRMEGKPFVLLGVNNDQDRDKAKALVAKEGMSWRSWYDLGTGGPIADRWVVEGWPTVFLLDHKGVVRYKGASRVNDGTAEKSLEEAVEVLLKEIEAKNRPGPEWVRDLEQAKKLAKASGKDLLIVFTGLGWCLPCKQLDQEVLHAKEFLGPASKDFVFVEFDSTFGDSPAEKRRAELHGKLQLQFLANSVPTVILADSDGVPYAIRTGYQSGIGPNAALVALRLAQMAKAQRDRFLKNAATLTGNERAEQLHKAISIVEPYLGSMDERGDDAVLTFYKGQVEDILRSAPAESVLRKKYESRIAGAKDWRAREAVFAKLKQFQATEDYPKAIEYIASALETTKDKGIRWRLESSRQIYLEWSEKYDEALTNSRRLQKLPDLPDKDREFLLDRESYNLFNLKRIDEGLAHYDRRIAAAKGDSTKRLRLIGMKAQMVVSHEGPIEKTVQACVEFREAAEPKSEPWWTASHLLAREYQRAGQHQKAIELLEELLAIDKQPVKTFTSGCLLAAAESYIALGQMDRAKAHIGDAKKAAAALARSGQKMDRDVAAYLERRIPELEKRMSNAKTK